MSENLPKIIELAGEELRKNGGVSRQKALTDMHVYFVRAIWRWFTATPENEGETVAEANIQMALMMLKLSQTSS